MPVHIKQPGDSLRPVSSESLLPTLPPGPRHNPLIYAFMAIQAVGMLTGAAIYLIFINPFLDEFRIYGILLTLLLLISSFASLATHILVLQRTRKHF